MIFRDSSGLRPVDHTYDICIVGAGAAGIILGVELDGTGYDVCVLEAGERVYDKVVQELFRGEVTGDRFPALRNTRLAALGGTTAVWAGWCRPLEELDFTGRPEVGSCAWPFSRDDLAQAYGRAMKLCGLANTDVGCQASQILETAALLPFEHADIAHHSFHVRANHFGEVFSQTLERSDNVAVCLRAPVLRLCTENGDDGISHVLVRAANGQDQRVFAKRFVLATGGIENARMLLLSGGSPDRSPGNAYGLVGRFFADHPFVDPGELVLTAPGALVRYFPQDAGGAGTSIRDVFSIREQILERERILNGGIFFYPRYEAHRAFATPEVKAGLEYVNKLRRKAVPGDGLQLLGTAMRAPAHLATAALRRLLIRNGPAVRWRLRAMFESEFRYDNFVELTRERDALGRPGPHVHWQLNELDLRSMARVVALLDQALRDADVGRIELAFPDTPEAWRAAAEGGKHHMGTTRMHRAASEGVVDPNGKVHGCNNLYLTGSSVFPSGGYANPTLTIVALAVRLAAHLNSAGASPR